MTDGKKYTLDRFDPMVFSETDKMHGISSTLCITNTGLDLSKIPGKVTQITIEDAARRALNEKFDLVIIKDDLIFNPYSVLLKMSLKGFVNESARILYFGIHLDKIRLPFILTKHTLSPDDTNIGLSVYVSI